MNFIESVMIAFKAIRVNKMRSVLTMLGIIIGISSVIAVFAIGNGGEVAINNEFETFGVNRMMLWHNWNAEIMTRDILTLDDLAAMTRVFSDEIDGISPNYSDTMTLNQAVAAKSDSKDIRVYGVSEDYDRIAQINVESGRFLIDSDGQAVRYVAVIDSNLAEELFGTKDVMGKNLDVSYYDQRMNFNIVGVYEKPKPSIFSVGNETPSVYIPYETMAKIIGLGELVYQVEITVNSDVDKIIFEDDVLKLLSRRHHNETEKYRLYSAENEMEVVGSVMGVITGIISAIAAISLIVGGIGVMNIMLVSVTERTREIGIRKAMGARRRDILSQFLIEAVIISLIGGIIGTIIGVGIATIASKILSLPPIVPINAVLIAWLFSATVGIFFGMYPANKAAKLNPIDALRYE